MWSASYHVTEEISRFILSVETRLVRFPRGGGRVLGVHGTGSFHRLPVGAKQAQSLRAARHRVATDARDFLQDFRRRPAERGRHPAAALTASGAGNLSR
jgi:hypothetical protein